MPRRQRGQAEEKIIFYPDPDVMEILEQEKERGYGVRGKYLNEAVRKLSKPPYHIIVPDSEEESSATLLIANANHELIITGLSLYRIIMQNLDLIKDRIRNDRLHMTIIIMAHDISMGDHVYEDLRQQLGGGSFIDTVISRTQEMLGVLRELRELGLKHRTPVRLLQCLEVPRYGFVITDHRRSGSRMRVNLFTSIGTDKLHPFIEINPSTSDGKSVYDVFYDYYIELVRRSKDII